MAAADRIASVEDIAAIVNFLCEAQSRWVIHCELNVGLHDIVLRAELLTAITVDQYKVFHYCSN